jgi:hypothetical protein
MLERHYPEPFELVCITDDVAGLSPRVRTIPLPTEHADLPNWKGDRFPSCYRRLRVFAPNAGAWLGATRIVNIDLDVVITGDMTPLFSGRQPFKCWGETNRRTPYNASLFSLELGSRPAVWDRFRADPAGCIAACEAAGYVGSDQAVMSLVLGPNEPRWTRADGVFSYRNDIRTVAGRPLPAGARIVPFHGQEDPWDETASRLPWVREHYR